MDIGAILRSDMTMADKVRALSAAGLPHAEIARRLGRSMDVDDILRSGLNVADKVRALDAAGLPRAEIARRLHKRYQHVRNVLEGDKLRRSGGPLLGVSDSARPYEAAGAAREVEDRGGGAYRLTVRDDGSVLLPSAVREAFGVGPSGAVMARLEGEEFKLISTSTAMKRIDEIMRPYRWTGGALASDELIAERRREAAREADD